MTEEAGTAYLKPGTLARPGPRGRVLRLLVGGVQVTTIVFALLDTRIFLRPEEPFSVPLFVVIWLSIGLVIGIRFFNDMVKMSTGGSAPPGSYRDSQPSRWPLAWGSREQYGRSRSVCSSSW